MLFGCVLCRVLYCIVSYLYVSCSRSITSEGEERANLSARMWFLFGEVSSWCLGWVALFYCGTPLAFHIFIWLRAGVVMYFVDIFPSMTEQIQTLTARLGSR